MPQRAINIVLAIAGSLVVIGLLIAGADAYASARRGPRWWRRTVGAGLAVLAMLGVGSCAEEPPRTMCYKPAVAPDAEVSLARLGQQLSILEDLACVETLSADAIHAALGKVESDLKVLTSESALSELSAEKRAEAVELRARARVVIARMRANLERDLDLQSTSEWQEILAAWRMAAPLAASGKSTTAEREDASQRLKRAREAAGRLAARGELTSAESVLLQLDAARIKGEIYRNPPTNTNVMCYDMAFMPPASVSLQRLTQRLPLLKKLSEEKRVSRAAVEMLLPPIEADLAVLANEAEIKRAAIDADQAKTLMDAARSELEEIRALLKERGRDPNGAEKGTSKPMALDQTVEWQRVVETWQEAEKVASGKLGEYPFDQQGKQDLIQKLSQASDDVSAIAVDGRMSYAEAGLLGKELMLLTERVSAKRPTELKMATCYKPVMIQPARDSMERLQMRVPLLEQLAASGKIQEEVMGKVLNTILSDLRTLADDEALSRLDDEQRAAAVELRDKAKELVEQLQPKR